MKNIKEYIENTMEQYWGYLPDASKPFKDWTELEKEAYYRYTGIEKILFFIDDKLKNFGERSEPPHPLLSDVLADVKVIHKKTGKDYFMSKQQIINCTNKDNGETMILYTDGKMIFAREKSEFFNKFDIVL